MKTIRKSWTEEKLIADAKKYIRRREWQDKSGAAYVAAFRRGKILFEKCCEHMKGNKRNWSDEELLADAKLYSTPSAWRDKSRRAYMTAVSRSKSLFKKCCKHMKAWKSWKDEVKIKAEAKKYNSRTEWQKKSRGSYLAALKKGTAFYEKCEHMKKT